MCGDRLPGVVERNHFPPAPATDALKVLWSQGTVRPAGALRGPVIEQRLGRLSWD